jgi:hypothetical protein
MRISLACGGPQRIALSSIGPTSISISSSSAGGGYTTMIADTRSIRLALKLDFHFGMRIA